MFINTENAIKGKNYYILNCGSISPITLFIASLMNGVGIYHLYDKADFLRLIYRLSVLHHQNGLLASFFTNDVLFIYEHGDNEYEIKVKDFLDHYGLKISEPIHNIGDKQWNKEYFNIWTESQNMLIRIGKIDRKLGHINKYTVDEFITAKMKRDARFFISLIDKELDKSVFRKWKKDNSKFLIEFEKEIQKRERKFKISDIPGYIVDEFYDHLMNEFDYREIEDEEIIEEVIKLVWCYIFDMFYYSPDGTLLIFPEVNFKYDLFKGVGNTRGTPDADTLFNHFKLNELYNLMKEEFYE